MPLRQEASARHDILWYMGSDTIVLRAPWSINLKEMLLNSRETYIRTGRSKDMISLAPHTIRSDHKENKRVISVPGALNRMAWSSGVEANGNFSWAEPKHTYGVSAWMVLYGFLQTANKGNNNYVRSVALSNLRVSLNVYLKCKTLFEDCQHAWDADTHKISKCKGPIIFLFGTRDKTKLIHLEYL